ncbi:MAG: 7-carboxy-7-deazaguanine synthase QueE [Bacteroidota bacterium]
MKLANLNGQPEIFYTLQGEGKSMGMPSVFVRLSLCNLYCKWCDTDYTWNWEGTPFEHVNDENPGYQKFHKKDMILEIGAEELASMIRYYDCKNLVLTGGEPLLQQRELLKTVQLLKAFDRNYRIEIETNGTQVPVLAFDSLVDQYNVSPKLSNAGIEVRFRERPKAMTFFARHPRAFFKFVVSSPFDLEEVDQLMETYSIPPQRMYLMPEGTLADTLEEKQLWLTEACKERGVNFTTRLHVLLYGDRRGV